MLVKIFLYFAAVPKIRGAHFSGQCRWRTLSDQLLENWPGSRPYGHNRKRYHMFTTEIPRRPLYIYISYKSDPDPPNPSPSDFPSLFTTL